MAGFNESEDDRLYRSLREYSRVDAYLPVQIYRVAPEDRQNVRSHIAFESVLTEHPEMPELDDKVMAECLQILNAKLDTILRMLAFPDKKGRGLELEMVNISAGGVSTFTRDPFEPGEMVEIRLMLPSAPFNILYVYGNVVKCEICSEKPLVYIEYTLIDEDIREQIAKYVFERQREILRKKRRP
ncbi:MAG: PilZ domain-containing protein [Syntrophobacteraceae bacterium]